MREKLDRIHDFIFYEHDTEIKFVIGAVFVILGIYLCLHKY